MEEIDNENEILLNKLSSLEKKVLDYLNVKFKINITGKEINIDLNNKNIGNIDLMLLTSILSDNLEYINLSHNRISDIRPLKDLKKVKKIDLSFNNLKDYSINSINDTAKDNLSFRKNISINLDNNGLLEKDINEIKSIIMRGNEASLKSENNEDDTQSALIYKLNKLQQKILFYFNNKLNIELTGKEIKLDLNNKI